MNSLLQGISSTIKTVLVIGAILVIGGTGWFVWQAKDKTNKTLTNTAQSQGEPVRADSTNKTTETPVDPTKDWVSYSNKAGVFQLKHPKSWVSAKNPESCSEELVLFGGNAASVGICASEEGGQISVSSTAGKHDDDFALDKAHYSGYTQTVVEINGVQGSISTGTYKDHASDVVGGYPDGTKIVQYVFVANNDRTYVARYAQKPTYPNVLADFTTMVTKTLKFTP